MKFAKWNLPSKEDYSSFVCMKMHCGVVVVAVVVAVVIVVVVWRAGQKKTKANVLAMASAMSMMESSSAA